MGTVTEPSPEDRVVSGGEPKGPDLYAVLGLEPRASREQVERAYRFCLERYGESSLATYSLLEPAEAEQQRTWVREAYETLVDEQKRRDYDESHGLLRPRRTRRSRARARAPRLPDR